MAEALKFTSVDEALAVFSDLSYQVDSLDRVSVYNSSTGEYVDIVPGQYIVKVSDRYEVKDKKPARAKKAK